MKSKRQQILKDFFIDDFIAFVFVIILQINLFLKYAFADVLTTTFIFFLFKLQFFTLGLIFYGIRDSHLY